ncbi:M56 family metallopeptidase [Anaerocolumna xylanovorans]|uniref:Signal transducer regulating beta-lactamase production, contains metallopeptidase domain n=1 Tax=Anaerocolumna xylanovorans DSM 12503 TaxID=1121345 RepID=A0A1M7YGV3_9FIRM|nr:M56 family metallopeptidase [Anaerocolumna xylanovorans]SHO51748.1 Signal transducer regulating beta-lactamase production, contains metallopeptidase domain [Anaerocolumna xylanovorans DSM 12503]
MDLYHISFSSSILIVFILLLKTFSGYKLPRKTFTLLWKIVLIRLLIPVTIKIPVPDLWIIARKNVNQTGSTLRDFVLSGGTESATYQTESAPYKFSGAYILLTVWITVTAVLLCLFLLKYIGSRRQMREALPSENDYARNWVSSQRSMRSVRVLTFDRIVSPVTIGVFRPKIILPKNLEMDRGKRLEYVLTHEWVHIRRLDIIWKLLSMIAVCIYWFNPLVWLMYKQFNQDIEIACDEKVIKMFGVEAKPDYAYAIIQLMETKPQFSPMYNGFGQRPVEERITSIMKIGNPTRRSIIVSVTVILLSTMVFFTTVAAGSNYGAFDLGTVTGGETGNEHAKNPESRKYYPVNENGYTYGTINSKVGVVPDLICIWQAEEGYVYADEYASSFIGNRPDPEVQGATIDSMEQQEAGKICNVYLRDGETVIGTYDLINGDLKGIK